MSRFDQICENCRFFNGEYVRESKGECKRYPPQLVRVEELDENYWFSPEVHTHNCCGEWRPILESEHISAYDEEFTQD